MADHSFTRAHGGSGLGLAICKRLLDMMDGEISFESVEGLGSCFTFTLPLETCSESEFNSSNQQQPVLSPCCKAARVLVAEDNKANQMVVRNLFRSITPYTDIVTNGLEALNKVKEQDYDIVFMDVSMPTMDGLTACAAIRDLPEPHKSELPVIAFTAHALTGDKEKFLKAGMTDYLAKPVSLAKLIEMLNRYIPCDVSSEETVSTSQKVDHAQSEMATSPAAAKRTIETGQRKPQLLDESTLQQIIKDTNAELLPLLIDHYVEETRGHQDNIRSATAQEALDELKFEVHKLISSSLALGNTALSNLARAIELECRNGEAEQAYALARELDELINNSLQALLERKALGFQAPATA